MEKLQAWQKMLEAAEERRIATVLSRSGKVISDQIVEWACDYGESIPRVLATMVIVFLVFMAISWLGWAVLRVESRPDAIWRVPTRDVGDLVIFNLGALTTMDPKGLEPRAWWVQVLAGLEAVLGIALTGLLGFVLGNRIRRS